MFLWSEHLPTPHQLWTRSFWRYSGGFCWHFPLHHDYSMIWFQWEILPLSFDISELSAPFRFILYGFEVLTSTIKLQSISSIGPLVMKICEFYFFRIPNRWTNWSIRPHHIDVEIHWMFSDKIQNSDYLHHHWSDGADTLQFDSTDEYFETVEYEPERSTELRDIDGKSCWDLPFQWLDTPLIWCEMSINCASEPSNGPGSELRRSWELSWLWEHSISNPCDTLSASKRV